MRNKTCIKFILDSRFVSCLQNFHEILKGVVAFNTTGRYFCLKINVTGNFHGINVDKYDLTRKLCWKI